jgi:hypothetical protein
MTASGHDVLVNVALLGREFGYVDVWQASHELILPHFAIA